MVLDMVIRRFIAVFYPDCEYANTTVMAQVDLGGMAGGLPDADAGLQGNVAESLERTMPEVGESPEDVEAAVSAGGNQSALASREESGETSSAGKGKKKKDTLNRAWLAGGVPFQGAARGRGGEG